MNSRFIVTFGAALSALLYLANPSARAVEAGSKPALKLIAEGFVSPTVVTTLEDGSGRILIVDQAGTVHLLNKDGKLDPKLFLDLRSRIVPLNEGFDERGALGLALHPKFKENRKLYIYYSAPKRRGAPADWDHTSHISEFQVAGDGNRVDPATEKVLLQIDQPQANHNCGRMAFGPDGFLYIGVGDGGNANDEGVGHPPEGNAQNVQTLLGKILRIDVDKGTPYAIPSDNPYASGGGRAEIFAYGLRNPWGMSFDRGGKRELYATDVGQNMFEEINLIVKGGNYGWKIREGFICFNPANALKPGANCPDKGADGKPLVDPILVYKNFKAFPRDPEAKGISITGGYVYRGKAIPQLSGQYVFADWSRHWVKADGVLFTASKSGQEPNAKWAMAPLDMASHPNGNLSAYIVALGEDAEGELYVMTNGSNSLIGKSGKVHKLVPGSAQAAAK